MAETKGRDNDLRRVRALHRKLLAPLVRSCLAGADADLQEFARSLPEQVDSVEAHLKKFWLRKGLAGQALQDFAVGYGRTLAACPDFQAFETAMEELDRAAGQAGFDDRLAAAARQHGLDPESL